jgi:hypothetical protein
MSKKNRKTRALRVEGLENRELMAGDLGIALVNGTLNVTGSDAGDFVRVMQIGNNLSVYQGYSKPLRTYPLSSVGSLNIATNGGNDRIEVKASSKIFDAIFINLGSGSKEWVDVGVGGARSVTIDAKASLGTKVFLDGYFSGLASIDYGSDPAADEFYTQKSTFNRLDVKMGGGDDFCQLSRTSVSNASINMGSGDDRFNNLYDSNVQAGTIDGGTAVRGNRWGGPRFGSRVSVRGF